MMTRGMWTKGQLNSDQSEKEKNNKYGGCQPVGVQLAAVYRAVSSSDSWEVRLKKLCQKT
jgi:hypothetical protein